MKNALLWTLVLTLAVLTGLACDSANPVAPSGTTLTISASPNQISLDGTSTITVIGRQPNGNPLASGTEIRFSTNLGTIDPVIAEADGNGRARAILRGDGRAGTATVQATTTGGSLGGGGGGDSEEGGGSGGGTTSGASVSIDVEIGRPVGSVSLQATPASVPESGAMVQLLALVRDQDGEPLAEIAVNFRAQLGTLASGGSFIRTNSAGEASDTLTVTEGDLNSIGGDEFNVSVQAAGGGGGDGGAVQSDEVSVAILRRPEASFDFDPNGLTVVFQDTSSGNPTSWRWDFGDGSAINRNQNPTHRYNAEGDYTVRLEVENSAGTSEISQIVNVRVNNP
jgi:hypothetical protein